MKTVKAISALMFFIGCATAPAVTMAACAPSDIAVDKLEGRVQRNYIYIVGRLQNNCSMETGVEIKVTIYDKAGDILAINATWPASINNIPAKSYYPFEHMMKRIAGFSNFEVRVIATKTW